ncbi:MAG: hypothetical protein E3K37_10835 [Candidatus Kuenenia sp.]|nr:hypothetical protein [Candidatus Kuenenia hertensis]
MIKTFFTTVILAVLSICTFITNAQAIVTGLSTEELTKSSHAVITGTVEDVQSYWSNDRKTIFTSATIKLTEIIRGNIIQNTITVEYEGGEVEGIGLKISDMATLNKGEKILLFLKTAKSKRTEQKENVFRIVGRAQGKYFIDKNGIAKKSGFTTINRKEVIDNNIPIETLIDRIKGVK